jgi:hypothetical protein
MRDARYVRLISWTLQSGSEKLLLLITNFTLINKLAADFCDRNKSPLVDLFKLSKRASKMLIL